MTDVTLEVEDRIVETWAAHVARAIVASGPVSEAGLTALLLTHATPLVEVLLTHVANHDSWIANDVAGRMGYYRDDEGRFVRAEP